MRRKLISFDWAMKKLLRSKANFEILEGFLSELLKETIQILEVLESESNKQNDSNKFNRVDLKVKNQQGEIIIIEVQYEREFDYLQRIFFATSKVITEHLNESEPYAQVVKVISVNILYFDLGQGEDYVYHGFTSFKGLHVRDTLQLSEDQQEMYKKIQVRELFPEYYLIKVNNFDNVAKDTLDEWIYFLKNKEIKDDFQAKGIRKAKQELNILKLPEQDRVAYEKYLDNLHYQASLFESSYVTGMKKGEKIGEKKGEIKGEKRRSIEIARNLIDAGVLDIPVIAEMTGLTVEEVTQLSAK
ncbi:MAG: Rpn family recombination-promoting nuclease/putative transposase [Pseudomonadota bacterium]